jgi:hypothetical protein
MTQRVGKRLAFSLIADCAAMTATGPHRQPSSLDPADMGIEQAAV